MATKTAAQIGDRIRKKREDLGWTMAELGLRVGVSAATIWKWEHGRSRPRTRHLALVRSTLKIR